MVTLLEKEGKLREVKTRINKKEKQGCQIRLESRIAAIRRKLSYIHVLMQCSRDQKYTTHQREIKRKIEKQYGKTNTMKLLYISTQLKQELKIECHKLKNRKTIQERRYINRMFKKAHKKVYRSMKGENSGPVKDMLTKQNVQDFWSTLWGTPVQHKIDTPWIETLRNEYCRNAEQKQYEINNEILDKILSQMANDKPGRDLVCGVWIKRLKSLHESFKQELVRMLLGEIEPPDWLLTFVTLLLPKNEETKQPQNYRPIALQNAM